MSPPQRIHSRPDFNRSTFGMPVRNFGTWSGDPSHNRGTAGSLYHSQQQRQQQPGGGAGDSSHTGALFNGGAPGAPGGGPLPPAVPLRPDQQQVGAAPSVINRGRFGGFSGPPSYLGYSSLSPQLSYSGYSNPIYGSVYGATGYGGAGGYNNRLSYNNGDYYGGLGAGVGGEGGAFGGAFGGGGEASFIGMAEESSRQAFQSIESIVQAFGSVSMMLESTYHAVYSSFRAVIGVADHFSRLRDHLAQIISTLAVVRTLHWLFRKAIYIMGLSLHNPSSDGAWSSASRAALESLEENDLKGPRSSWPILMFLGVVFGAPWLIWRLLGSVAKLKPVSGKWMTGQDDHYLAVALYDFRGETLREISFNAGNRIILAPRGLQPKCRGWMLGTVDGKCAGLLPANYLKILGPRRKNPIDPSSPLIPHPAAHPLSGPSFEGTQREESWAPASDKESDLPFFPKQHRRDEDDAAGTIFGVVEDETKRAASGSVDPTDQSEARSLDQSEARGTTITGQQRPPSSSTLSGDLQEEEPRDDDGIIGEKGPEGVGR